MAITMILSYVMAINFNLGKTLFHESLSSLI